MLLGEIKMAFRGVLPEFEQSSGLDDFLQGISNVGTAYGDMVTQQSQNKKTADLVAQMTGLSPDQVEGIDPQHYKELLRYGGEMGLQKLKERGLLAAEALKGQKGDLTGEQRVQQIQDAKSRLNKMRELRTKGNLGGWIKAGAHHFGGESARDKGEYEQLGKSLISLASNIPIRNRQEFDTLSERLYSASITDAEAQGVLDGMEQILDASLKEAMTGLGGEIVDLSKSSSGKKRKSLEEIF